MKTDFLRIAKMIYKEYFLAKEIFADTLLDEKNDIEFDSAVLAPQLNNLRDIFSTFATNIGSSQQLSGSKKEFYPFVKKNGVKFDIYSLLFNGIPNSDSVFLSGLSMSECMSEFRRMDALKGQGKSIGPIITEFNKLLTLEIEKIKAQYSAPDNIEYDYLSNYFDDLLNKFEYIVESISNKFPILTYTNGQRSSITHIKDILNNSKKLIYTSDKDFEELRSDLVKLFLDSGINLKKNFNEDDVSFSAIFKEIEDQFVYFKSFVNMYNSSKIDMKTKLLMKVINNEDDLNTLLSEFKSNGKLVFSEETIEKLKSDDISTVRDLLSQSDFYPSKLDKHYELPRYKQLINEKKIKLQELVDEFKQEKNETVRKKIENKIEKLKNDLYEMGETLNNYINNKKIFDSIPKEETSRIHNMDQSFLNFISGETSYIIYSNLFVGIKTFSSPFYSRIKIDNGENIYSVLLELKKVAGDKRKEVGGNSLKSSDIPDDLFEKLSKVSEKINDMKKSIEENESFE